MVDPPREAPGSRRALCHEWLTTYGGSDQVAGALADTLGITDVYTYEAWRDTVVATMPQASLTVVGPRSSLAREHWQWFLPHMPLVWRSLDLSAYDLVVTSAHSCVNAIRPRRGTPIVSYCHTPMRYAWEWRSEAARFPRTLRPLWGVAAAVLRAADRRWAQRVDLFLANSRFVAGRIARYYGLPSLVVNPPIDTSYWAPGAEGRSDHFLMSGRLVAYKRPDLVVHAAAAAGVPLVVAGSGPMLADLQKIPADVRFVVDPSRDQLRDLYRTARAYVFAGVEDFGMSIVEAEACGTPVIAFGKGGAAETVTPSRSGVLLEQQTVPAFAEAMKNFDPAAFDSWVVRDAALRFDRARFEELIRWAVDRVEAGEWAELRKHPQWADTAGA